MSMDQKELLSQLPDLPELESVEMRNWQMLVAISGHLVLALAFGGMTGWIYLRYRQYLDARGQFLVALTVALTVWAVLRILFAGLYWRTDRRGITIRGILYHRFIEWTEVRDAHSKLTLSRALVYMLSTTKGRIIVPTKCDSGRYSGQELAASVWQHLRQTGKAGRLELPPEALTLWDSIPDELADDISWQQTGRKISARKMALGSALMPLLFLGGAIYIAVADKLFTGIFLAMLDISIACLFYGEYRRATCSVSAFRVTQNGVGAEMPRGPVDADWSEVETARWERSALVLQGRGWLVCLGYGIGDDERGKLILAVIRKLRSEGHRSAVVIPSALRAADGEEDLPNALNAPADSPGNAFLTTSLAEKIGWCIAAPMMLGLLPLYLDSRFHSALLTGSCVALTVLLGILAGRTYYYRITDQAVEKRFWWYHKRVDWSQVARFDFTITPKHSYRTWILRGSGGEKLLNITLDIGTKKHKQLFEQSLNAHLSRITPAVFDRPWLARPFGS